ncbi:MAG: hypothetical protein V1880_03240 [Patescibacteria group bacterium]
MRICKSCKAGFEVTDSDRAFYQQVDVPEPHYCPACRNQFRLAFRNERALYKRKCDLSGKSVISFYRSSSPYKVAAQDVWWSDRFDAMAYGRDFDFSRPFFEQFNELMKAVPHMAMIVSHGENSDYCPYSVYYKNSYMCVSGVVGENILYSYWTNDSRDCVDCYACFNCELCYECVECVGLYNSIFCKDSNHSSNLAFCVDCDGCKNCIGCFGLKNKEYYVFNQKVSREQFEKQMTALHQDRGKLNGMMVRLKTHMLNYPQREVHKMNTENSTGDYLINCRNARDCFLSFGLEDCSYCWNIPQGAKDSADINYSPKAELVYNSMSAVNAYNGICNVFCWDVKDVSYCVESFYSNDLFGCVGLKRGKYCILNRQYTKEDYLSLRAKIVEYMKKTGEWGEFFPESLSPFAYNETIAQDFYPLNRDEVLARGWLWTEDELPLPKVEKIIPASRLPDFITAIPDDVLNWAIECEVTNRPFRIIPQELKFYRAHQLPLPHRHPDQRYQDRLAWLNPRKLYDRKCAKCQTAIRTTYSPDRPEIVYCEQCYLKEVY